VAFQHVAYGPAGLVGATHAGDGSGRLFLLYQDGAIRIWKGGQLLGTPFLQLSCPGTISCGGERGLLGLAFHPGYEGNGFFYVDYTDPNGDLTIARYQVSATDPDLADPVGVVLLSIPHSGYAEKNGGHLQFGPDGLLYIGTGDGGGVGDPSGNAQDLGSLLGKILRIDVDGAFPYAIPPSNPFVGTPGARGEIWDYGLQNPWRFGFDRLTGDLLIGDVGQSLEEVDFEPAGSGGRNYGWNRMEGTICYEPPGTCDDPSLVRPVLKYPHDGSLCWVNGGYRYRGALFPDLQGIYFYSDRCQGAVWAATQSGDGSWASTQVILFGNSPSGFGEDEQGGAYLTKLDGSVWRILGDGDLYLSFFAGYLTHAQAGADVTYALQVRNAASTPALSVSASIQLPSGFALVSSDMGCQAGGTVVTCPFGDVPPGMTPIANVVLRMPAAAGTYSLPAQVTSASPDSDPGDNAGVATTTVFVPTLLVQEAAVVEEAAAAEFSVSVWPTPLLPVSVDYATADVTATAGADYVPVSGTLSLAPGTATASVTVPVLEDGVLEPDEYFSLDVSAPSGVDPIFTSVLGRIVNDEVPRNELVHASVRRRSLESVSQQAQVHLYSLRQAPFSSYEVVVDAVSGGLGASGPALWRVNGYGTGLLQQAEPVSGGTSLSLRFANPAAVAEIQQYVLVKSQGCTRDCGPEAGYRIRVRETTMRAPRYNNAGSQVSVLVLQNDAAVTVIGRIWFLATSGAFAGDRWFALPPHGTLALNTADVVPGSSGSVTVSSNAPYGGLSGKVTALEPATGFSFDTPLLPRP
jgi:uncharacterized repeat protein (TIGR01451 family)